MRTPFIQLNPVLSERMEKAFVTIEENAGNRIKATRPNHIGNYLFDFAAVPFGQILDLLQVLEDDLIEELTVEESTAAVNLSRTIQSKLIICLLSD